jgi:hypothetical protein
MMNRASTGVLQRDGSVRESEVARRSLARAPASKAAIISTPERLSVSPLRPWIFWHTSGLRSDESVEFLESIVL